METIANGDALLVGRAVRKGLRLHGDDAASRNHCLLVVGAGQARVEDLGSRNGTLLNGARIAQPVQLRSGDRVAVGRTVIQVRLVGSALGPTVVECRRCGAASDGTGTVFDEADDPAAGRICVTCRARVAEEEPQALFAGFAMWP